MDNMTFGNLLATISRLSWKGIDTFLSKNMGIGLLHVKRMTVTAIFFKVFFNDFMRNSNFGIGVLHVKCQILTYLL